MSVRLAVFASGGGSNLQALIDRFHHKKQQGVRIVLVLSDRASAGALQRARDAGIEAAHVSVTGRPVDFVAREMLAALEAADVDLIALAGFLKLVPAALVRRFRDRIVNIHPALLPAFGGTGMYGLRVHRAVLDAGCKITGATVHFVNETYDEGRIIAQWPVPVMAHDTPESLAARVLKVEHILFPAAVEMVARSLDSGVPQVVRDDTSQSCFIQLNQSAPAETELRRALGVE